MTIRNELTGIILVQGKTTGSTGNTNLITVIPHNRYERITDNETAKFLATVEIEETHFYFNKSDFTRK